MTNYLPASQRVFQNAFAYARATSLQVADATSPADTADGGSFFLSEDGQSGFRVNEGELTHVFSLPRGRGSDLVPAAVLAGAKYLDCFDGYLPQLYSRFGFKETKRDANWTAGAPDIVYMAI